ncbi:hypothetical protein RhiJN_23762 [Ceratobasidium sp. AG-Ba]|nr:hypothetical protein RhiJN_23762 [Ceratobasidium sp. AG-Ba]
MARMHGSLNSSLLRKQGSNDWAEMLASKEDNQQTSHFKRLSSRLETEQISAPWSTSARAKRGRVTSGFYVYQPTLCNI